MPPIEANSPTTYKSILEGQSEIVIGNENSSKFEPHIRVKKWGEECYFSFGLPTDEGISSTFNGEKITWNDPKNNRRFHFYEHSKKEGMEQGGFEYEIILDKPPTTPTLEFPANLTNLTLDYQGELSEFEIERGNIRPENVVGSYAAYHKSKTPIHGIEGNAAKYKAGKAFHIYRPYALDANNKKLWLKMIYDQEGEALSIVLDHDWFANAAYPVLIDPTVGYTTLGASTDNTNTYENANSFTPSDGNGDANPGTAYYGGRITVGTASVYVGVYDFGDGNISANNRLAVSSAITLDTTAAFRSAAITWTGITSGTTYYITAYSNTALVQTRYDTGATAEYTNLAGQAASPPDPHITRSGTSANFKTSVYVDYTASGGAGTFVPLVGPGGLGGMRLANTGGLAG